MTSKPETVQQRYCQKVNEHIQKVQIEDSRDLESSCDEIPIDKSVRITDPGFWGPGLWRAIHAGSLNYPNNASKLMIDKMKGFIYGLPAIMACKSCSTHARSYIQKYDSELSQICETRESLFKFFVDFHNHVNEHQKKKILSYADVLNLYNSSI
jgi:hypothetical protein